VLKMTIPPPKLIIAFILLLFSPSPSFGEKQYFDLLLVKVEEGKLTISREPVVSEDENSTLKLNVDTLRKEGIFSVHQPGKWCQDIHVSMIGYVRVIIEVSNTNLNKTGKGYLPINLVVAINRRPMVNRIFGIDQKHKKPLNKVVVRGDSSSVELHRGDEKPEILYFDSTRYVEPLSDLLLRPNEEPNKSCFKEFWGIVHSESNEFFDDDPTPNK
jgi:hypothetical protein